MIPGTDDDAVEPRGNPIDVGQRIEESPIRTIGTVPTDKAGTGKAPTALKEKTRIGANYYMIARSKPGDTAIGGRHVDGAPRKPVGPAANILKVYYVERSTLRNV